MSERKAEACLRPGVMLVTGANGFIGSRLCTLGLARGYQVRTLTRRDWSDGPAVPIEQRYYGSLPGLVPTGALAGVDLVVHLAASTSDSHLAARAVNVDGTLQLAREARAAGVGTFIFFSSQSSQEQAATAYGRTKYEAEQGLLQLDDLRVIILRPGLVTGPGRGGLYQRLRKTVTRLPILPLLGGGRSIVQPIHVDDLCEAVFRCHANADQLDKSVLCLGDPRGLTLKAFLELVARAHLGRPRPAVDVPIWPVEVLVSVATRLGLPLPVNRNNLRGLQTVRRMDTASSLNRLGLRLRSLPEMVRPEVVEPGVGDPNALAARPVRVLLVGAGRIGVVHAVTASRLQGVELVGLVDRQPAAARLLLGMGVSAPAYTDLDEAIEQARPDAAIIATPVASHLPLATSCLEQGLAVLIEKPLAIRAEQLSEYERLGREWPERPMQVGYVMLRNPQVLAFLERLRKGEFGAIRGFVGISLLSFIREAGSKRWEVQRDTSGGGAFINSGGHVLSMIVAACGEPHAIAAESAKLFSTEVEDSLVLQFDYPGFRGVQYCSWSIGGYPRQENLLAIETERGQVLLSASMGVFVPEKGDVEVIHQLDFDVGFNLAPDYAGGGFSAELSDLAGALRTGEALPVSVDDAVALERLLFRVYDSSREVPEFTAPSVTTDKPQSATLPRDAELPVADGAGQPRPILDLRDLSVEAALGYLGRRDGLHRWDEFLLYPGQLRNLPLRQRRHQRLRVTVPDFLAQSRLLAAGQYDEVVRQIGLVGLIRAGMSAAPVIVRERRPTFWVAEMGLLAAALAAIPARFRGTILLHSYLTDLALSLRRVDMLQQMLEACRARHPQARVGFHTNMAREALSALHLLPVRVDEVSALTSPHALDMDFCMRELRSAGRGPSRRLTAEVGLAPAVVHQAARAAPARWAFGADAVLIGADADAELYAERRRQLAGEWAKVFPGLDVPTGVL